MQELAIESVARRCSATPQRRRRQHGFTLIELLVVIAIIALLVSILMPTLAKAKVLAKRTMCSVNERSLWYAEMLYTQDWNDYFTQNSGLDPDGTVQGNWWSALDSYVIGNTGRFSGISTEGMGAFACPSARYAANMPDGPHYGLNAHLWPFTIGATQYPAVKASQIKTPSVSGLFTDRDQWDPGGYHGPITYIWNYWYYPTPRHGGNDVLPTVNDSFGFYSGCKGMMLTGWADGHVILQDFQTVCVTNRSAQFDVPWYYSLPDRS